MGTRERERLEHYARGIGGRDHDGLGEFASVNLGTIGGELRGLYQLAVENADLREMLKEALSLAGTANAFLGLRERRAYIELRVRAALCDSGS